MFNRVDPLDLGHFGLQKITYSLIANNHIWLSGRPTMSDYNHVNYTAYAEICTDNVSYTHRIFDSETWNWCVVSTSVPPV